MIDIVRLSVLADMLHPIKLQNFSLFNVLRNNALAASEATSTEGTALWAGYLIAWTKWNHVRTIAALMAAASFTIALTR
jgi:uncharacterized membrane protein